MHRGGLKGKMTQSSALRVNYIFSAGPTHKIAKVQYLTLLVVRGTGKLILPFGFVRQNSVNLNLKTWSSPIVLC